MAHTVPSAASAEEPLVPQLHLDTNHDKQFRCATVLMYLNDVPKGKGGETRFPLAGAGRVDDPLVSIGVVDGAGGKFIVQKFKEVPLEERQQTRTG